MTRTLRNSLLWAITVLSSSACGLDDVSDESDRAIGASRPGGDRSNSSTQGVSSPSLGGAGGASMVPLPRCPSGQLSCEGRCVSPDRDDMFCGTGARCEELTTCQEGERCESGSCVAGCPSGRTFCSDGCYDLESSAEHCGECGDACSLGSVCASGKCREVARSLRSPEVIDQGSVDFDLQMDPKGNALIVWRHPEEGPRALYYSAASDKFRGLSVPSLDESAKMPRVTALAGEGWLVAWAGRKSVITWFLGNQATGFEDLNANWLAEARCETQGKIEQLAWVSEDGQSPVLAVSEKGARSCTFISSLAGYSAWVFAAQGGDLQLDFSGEDAGIAVYQSNGHYRASARQEAGWIPPVVLEQKSAVERIAVAGDGEGRGLVLFSRKKTQALGAHSLAPQLTPPSELPAKLYGLARTERGTLVAAFSEVSPLGEDTLYLRRLAQGVWQDAHRVPSAIGGTHLVQEALDLGTSRQGYFAVALAEHNEQTAQLSLLLGGKENQALRVIPTQLAASPEAVRVAASPLGHALIATVGESGSEKKPEFSISVWR